VDRPWRACHDMSEYLVLRHVPIQTVLRYISRFVERRYLRVRYIVALARIATVIINVNSVVAVNGSGVDIQGE